jgi:hypothetical protein
LRFGATSLQKGETVDMNPSTALARMRNYFNRESTISSMNILDEPRFSLSKLGGLDWKNWT